MTTIPTTNVVPDSWQSEPWFNIAAKYLPTETEERELQEFLTFDPAYHKLTGVYPRLVERHPSIPRLRKMVTGNKRVIDPLDPDQVTAVDSICPRLAALSQSKDQIAYRILRPLFWELSRMFPLEIAKLLLAVPTITPELRAALSPSSRPHARGTTVQVELQNMDGMYELFLEFLNSLRKPPADPGFHGTRLTFLRLYLAKEFSHHLSIVNRYCGASDEPVPVATHSVLCYRIALMKINRSPQYNVSGGDLRRRLLAVLLHDTGEAYLNDQIGFIRDRDDVISIAEAAIMARIYSIFGIGNKYGQLTVSDMEFVAMCDKQALAYEFENACGDPTADLMESKSHMDPMDISTGNYDEFRLVSNHAHSSYMMRAALSSILHEPTPVKGLCDEE